MVYVHVNRTDNSTLAISLPKGHRFLTITEWAKTYGPVYRIQLGRETVVVLSGYDVIQEALVKRGEDFSTRPADPLTKLLNPQRLGKNPCEPLDVLILSLNFSQYFGH